MTPKLEHGGCVRTAIGIAWLGTFASVFFIVFSPLPRLRSVAEVAHADRA